jgi:hypothetical protein
MPSHAEERSERDNEVHDDNEGCERPASPPSTQKRAFHRHVSSSSDSSSGSSSGSCVYPGNGTEEAGAAPRDPRLNLTSSLHRMLTYPVGIAKKLRLNVEALAGVGFYWNAQDRLQCFKCQQVEQSVIHWQDLNFKQVQLRHYECTHPADDDIPPSRAATCLNYEAHRYFTFFNDK